MVSAADIMLLPVLLGGFTATILLSFFHKFLGTRSHYFLCLIPLFFFIYFASYALALPLDKAFFSKTSWVEVMEINLAFRMDGLSLIFSLLISFLGILIVFYSGRYLKPYHDKGKYYFLLMMFMISMLGLVLSDHLLILFLFWELTTFSSFLLIGFNHEKKEARMSAWQAIIVTTLGALAMLAGFILLALISDSYDISNIMGKRDVIVNHDYYPWILSLILLGTFTKSAQFPFSFWLPSAMMAPTPISAYLHSATMVKAGIYLMARLLPVIGHTSEWFYSLTIVGTITIITSSVQAIRQDDLKLVLAYLTLAALGALTLLLGIGSEEAIKAMIIFLIMHSLYKGCLFLVVGNIDHTFGTRLISQLEGLWRKIPLTSIAAIIAIFTLSGLPPTLGFLGKEMIYKSTLLSGVLVVPPLIMMVSSTYIGFRLLFGVFFSKTPFRKKHSETFPLYGPPLLLSTIVLLSGISSWWMETNFIKSIVGSIIGGSVEGKVFEGVKFNKALALSALSLLLGFIVYYKIKAIHKICSRFIRLFEVFSPERGYKRLTVLTMDLGRYVERVSMRGYYYKYFSIILMASIVAIIFGLVSSSFTIAIPEFKRIENYEWGLVIVIVVSTLGSIIIKSLIASVMFLGVIGFTIAIIFVSYGAPDLALTQLIIETLTIILFALIAIKFPNRHKNDFFNSRTRRDLFVSVTFGSLVTIILWGVMSTPLKSNLSQFFADNSYLLAKGRNVVNVILVDFRAFDTLGEVTVLSIAGLGFFSLLKMMRRRN